MRTPCRVLYSWVADDAIIVECAATSGSCRGIFTSSTIRLDDNKLTYFHGGRFKQLSQFGGAVIKQLIA
jgi:hypothetical protein